MGALKPKAIVLLSGGLDSTYNLYRAVRERDVVQVLTFNYGQRAAGKEAAVAKKICASLDLPWLLIDVPFLSLLGGSSLTQASMKLPLGGDVSIADHSKSLETAASVWVPNRNGLFLNIAGCFADRLGAEKIIPGFNFEEASTFPDNSEAFISAINESLKFSTRAQSQVECFSIGMNKVEIVAKARELGVDFSQLWSCYQSFDKWCGECESCLRSARAFQENGIDLKECYL